MASERRERGSADLVADALAGDVSGWRGLAGDETEAVLEAVVAPVAETDRRTTERSGRRCELLRFEREAAPGVVEAWFTPGSSAAFLVEWDDPLVDTESVLGDLGPPLVVLTDERHSLDGLVHEHVHSDFGLAVAVLEPFTGGPRSIVHLQLFAPMSPGEYVQLIGTGPRTRYRPALDR